MDDLIMHSPSLASDPWDVSVDPASRGPGHRGKPYAASDRALELLNPARQPLVASHENVHFRMRRRKRLPAF